MSLFSSANSAESSTEAERGAAAGGGPSRLPSNVTAVPSCASAERTATPGPTGLGPLLAAVDWVNGIGSRREKRGVVVALLRLQLKRGVRAIADTLVVKT
jgi:hypothetical protein